MSRAAAKKPAGPARPEAAGGIEIEAKYAVPDERTFARLLRSTRMGSCVLRARGEVDVVDRYLDTTDRALARGGWACRVREIAGGSGWTVAIKELGRVRGAVHRRREHEIAVAHGAAPPEWPASPVRDLVLELAAAAPLGMLLALRQRRVLHDVLHDVRRVAVRFLDRGTIEAGGRRVTFLELELELVSGGTSRDLRLLEKSLKRYDLRPEPRSKFERGLTLLDAGALSYRCPLAPVRTNPGAGGVELLGWRHR